MTTLNRSVACYAAPHVLCCATTCLLCVLCCAAVCMLCVLCCPMHAVQGATEGAGWGHSTQGAPGSAHPPPRQGQAAERPRGTGERGAEVWQCAFL